MIDYDDILRGRLAARLGAHDRRAHELGGHRHAAVAVVLVDSDPERDHGDPLHVHRLDVDDMGGAPMMEVPGDTEGLDGRIAGVAGGASLLLCRRASRLNRHAGQFALPGGRVDTGETPEEAARREVLEEIGLELGDETLLGALDDYTTRSGYVITPFVFWAGGDPDLHLNPAEVAAVYRIGLHTLDTAEVRFVDIPESDKPVIQILFDRNLIHAPTAAVLYQFQLVALHGRTGARVDHVGEPVFAWT